MTDNAPAPIGRPFEPGREKTGGRQAGTPNLVPSKRAVQRRLIAQVDNSLKRHTAVIDGLYAKDPIEAAKLDARVNRDCIELLTLSEKFADGAPATGNAQIGARVEVLGPVTDEEAMSAYLRLVAGDQGSDECRIYMARFALTQRKQLDEQLEALAIAAAVTVDQVRAMLDAASTVLEPEALRRLAAPQSFPTAPALDRPLRPRRLPPPIGKESEFEDEEFDGEGDGDGEDDLERLSERESAALRHQAIPTEPGGESRFIPAPQLSSYGDPRDPAIRGANARPFDPDDTDELPAGPPHLRYLRRY